MTILSQLTDEMKNAMRAKDSVRLSALRMLISAVRYVAIDQGELTDEQVVQVLQKEAKKRRESIEAYRSAGREEQAKAEEYELSVIEEYLPKMMSEEEAREAVSKVLAGLADKSNYGLVMRQVMTELKGKVDGGVIAKLVKEALS